MNIKTIIPLLKPYSKTFVFYYIVLFTISTLFPIIASVSYIKPIQTFMGIMDISLAVLCFVGYYILTLLSDKERGIQYYQKLVRAYRNLNTIPLLILLLYFTGVHIKWDVLIIGLAWRMFLFSMVLPDLLVLLNPVYKDNIT